MPEAISRYGVVLIWLIAVGFPQLVDAGGAVKAQNNMKSRQQQAVQVQQQAIIQQRMKEEALRQRQQLAQQQYSSPLPEDKVEEVVDLKDIISSLDQSGQDWQLMIDMEAKALVVHYYIQRFRQQGISILKDPMYYAVLVDGMSQANPEMLAQPFANILQVVAVIEYDFDNGQDKEVMALQVLGSPQAVRANKERLKGSP
jgi:hypothetical protein